MDTEEDTSVRVMSVDGWNGWLTGHFPNIPHVLSRKYSERLIAAEIYSVENLCEYIKFDENVLKTTVGIINEVYIRDIKVGTSRMYHSSTVVSAIYCSLTVQQIAASVAVKQSSGEDQAFEVGFQGGTVHAIHASEGGISTKAGEFFLHSIFLVQAI
jgi:hypothetical protein